MKSNNEKQKKKNKHFVILVILATITASTLSLIFIHDQTNLMTQTATIMDGIPNHCYVTFPDMKNLNPDNAGAIYYQDMINAINKKGIKYPYPFLRSASLQLYLFENCPYLDHSKYEIPKSFNQSITSENMLIKPSKYLVELQGKEEKFHQYDFKANPENYKSVEALSSAFGLTLPQTVDRMFWDGVTNFDSCINPSWRSNSEIRQCSYGNTKFIVDLNEQLVGILTQAPNMTNHKY